MLSLWPMQKKQAKVQEELTNVSSLVSCSHGANAIVQPGGSKRDQDVIDAVEKAGAVMVFTGRRHFRH